MPRAGLTPAGVVDLALGLIDERGPEALTLADVAARAGVATPSLYRHVGSIAELRVLVAARVLDEMAAVATTAALGRSGDDAVRSLMLAVRRYSLDHPSRLRLTPADPLHDPALAEPASRLMSALFAVLRAYALDGSAAVHALRCVRAMVHGFTAIEAVGGFGLAEETDESYQHLIEMYLAYLHKQSP